MVAQSLAFQRKWQRLSMSAYAVSTVGILLCTTGGIYAAARDNTQIAAALAAVSTILIGLEKSLLFREKWKFHLAIATRLSTEEGKRTSRRKLARHPETGETAILCRSADRRGKERAMHDKFSRRIGE